MISSARRRFDVLVASLVGSLGCGSDALVQVPPSVCGNGVLDSGEICDDGYTDDCGTCNADCSGAGSGAVCGDRDTCPEAEACDDGYSDECGSCNADCTAKGGGAVCGDGEVCPEFEACDDGYADDCGSCDANCAREGNGATCGDHELCPEFEACDDGYTDACGSCNADCSGPGQGSFCSDGVVCPETEACDDGYNDACGACNADCTGEGEGSVCGDGRLCEESESCDDGNRVDGDGCDNSCTVSDCGNGVVAGREECDDGNLVNGDGCDRNCTPTGCGNGVATDGEDCDFGVFNSDVQPDACRSSCEFPGCGDGVVDSAEECDDGNQIDHDGCDTRCEWEECGIGELGSCYDLLRECPDLPSGVYWIRPLNDVVLEAYCDMTTDAGGWTVIDYQRDSQWSQCFSEFELRDDAVAGRANSCSSWRAWFAVADQDTAFRQSSSCERITSPGSDRVPRMTGDYYGCYWYNRNCDFDGLCHFCRDNYNYRDYDTPGTCPWLYWYGPDDVYCHSCGGDWWNSAPSIGINGTNCVAYR